MCKLLASLTFLTLAGIAPAAPILAPGPQAPDCFSIGVGLRTDVAIPFATWTAANFACEAGDKIFSNFNAGANVPTDTVLVIQDQVLGPFEFHLVTFNANFIDPFSISYDVAVDLTQNSGNSRILRVSGDLSNPANVGNPATTKTVFTEAGANLGTILSVTGNPGTPLTGLSATALHIVDAYVPQGGAAVSISNGFAQTQIPEPATLMLCGGALLLFSRRIKRLVK